MPGHSPEWVENNFRRQISFPTKLRCEKPAARYKKGKAGESVDQGNVLYHFGGIGWRMSGRLELDDSSTDSNCNRLSAVIGTEFLHDMFNVHFDSFL